MNWLDILLVVIIATITILEMRKGFGRAIFHAAGAIGVTWVSTKLYPGLANLLHASEAFAFCLLFFILGALAIFLAYIFHAATLLTAEPYDAILGGLFGFIAGWAVCNALVKILLLSYGGTPALLASGGLSGLGLTVKNSGVAQEFLNFVTYHKVITWLNNMTKVEPTAPNP